MVEAHVKDSVSQFRRGADIGCHLYLCLHLINIHFSSTICVNMNIFIHGCSCFDSIYIGSIYARVGFNA